MAYKSIGELLLAAQYITEQQLTTAQELQKSTPGKKLEDILVEQGFTTRRRVYQMMEKQLGVTFIDLGSVVIEKEMARLLPRALARKHNVVPVRADANTIWVALADPLNFVATEAVRMAVKRKVVTLLAAPDAITRAITSLYGSESAEKALQDLKGEENEAATDCQNIAAANIIGADSEHAAPTIRLVNSFLEYAVNQNVSDIHLEPREAFMAVRMRIDGVLRHVFTVPRNTQSAGIARIKVMGNMNIAEHKIPLDGRSYVRIGE